MKPLTAHTDDRGAFIELLHRHGEQVSYSSSLPGVTRGNHWHAHKREKFIVIEGEAVIRLRKLGTDQVKAIRVSGDSPVSIEIPSHTVHNITNTGNNVMHLIIWCSERFNVNAPDTNAERVQREGFDDSGNAPRAD